MASNPHIRTNAIPEGIYILTRNDVTIYFWSIGNRTNVFIWWSCWGRDFSIMVRSISKRITVLESEGWFASFVSLLCNMLDAFAPWPRKRAQMDLPSSTHYKNGWFPFSPKLPKLATHRHIPRRSLHPHRKWQHQLLPVGCKSCSRPPLPSPISPTQTDKCEKSWKLLW